MNIIGSTIGALLIGAAAVGGWTYASDGAPPDLPELCADRSAQTVLWRLLWERDFTDFEFAGAVARLHQLGVIKESSTTDLMERVRAVGAENVFHGKEGWSADEKKEVLKFAKILDFLANTVVINDDAVPTRIDDRIGRVICTTTFTLNFKNLPDFGNAEQNRFFQALAKMYEMPQLKKIQTRYSVQQRSDGRLWVTLLQ